jgi:hypothetical protein
MNAMTMENPNRLAILKIEMKEIKEPTSLLADLII